MSRLTEAYRAARADYTGINSQQLEPALETLVERGRAAHPELTLAPERFAGHLGRCRAVVGDPSAAHAEDLYLACAAIDGDEIAIKKLQRKSRPALAKYLRSIDAATAFLAEVEQQVWEALLVGRDGGDAKLGGYSGKGPLTGFVGIAAQRVALTGLRRQSIEARAEAEAAAVAVPALSDPELAFVKGKYGQDFHAAIRDALAILAPRERLIYRMHLVDGLAVDRIAAAYSVSQSTVSRWMAKARAAVMSEVRRLLRERLKLSDSNLESILGLMLSQLDISASQVLATMPTPAE
jgi:RNA polymerase sigma-70 factor, ECF subfamily